MIPAFPALSVRALCEQASVVRVNEHINQYCQETPCRLFGSASHLLATEALQLLQLIRPGAAG